MTEPLPEQIIRKIDEVKILYHRLILVVAPPGGGKTEALQEVAKRTELPLINLNLELSRRLLDLTERQRVMRVSRLLGDIVNNYVDETILLDNTEILFDTSLKQNPLLLLQGVSRNKVIVAAWNGTVEKGHLTYATPDHPEYRRYPTRDLVFVAPAVVA
jgi:hypothetical protein